MSSNNDNLDLSESFNSDGELRIEQKEETLNQLLKAKRLAGLLSNQLFSTPQIEEKLAKISEQLKEYPDVF